MIYVIKDFPREQRYVVGDRIERTAIESLHIIARVYIGRNLKARIAEMTELQSNLELLNTLIEIAGEHQWIKGRSKLANLLLLMDSIGRHGRVRSSQPLKGRRVNVVRAREVRQTRRTVFRNKWATTIIYGKEQDMWRQPRTRLITLGT